MPDTPLRTDLQNFLDAYGAAWRAGDAAGCAAVFAHEGVLTAPATPPARGQAAIERLHARWFRDGGAEGTRDKRLQIVEAGRTGDLAWCLAQYGEAGVKGLSLNVLERQGDGHWLIRMCSLTEAE